jgi:hypothetical protein
MRLIPSTNPNRKSGYVLGILSRLFGTTQIASSYPGLTSWTTFSNLQPSLRDWHRDVRFQRALAESADRKKLTWTGMTFSRPCGAQRFLLFWRLWRDEKSKSQALGKTGHDEPLKRCSFGGGPAFDQAGRDEDGFRRRIGVSFTNMAQQRAGGGSPHLVKRLADGGERGVVGCGAGDIVKSNDGDFGGNGNTGFVQRGDGSDRRNIVEGKNGREMPPLLQQSFRGDVSWLAALNAFQLNDQCGIDRNAELGTDLANTLPARVGVGTEGLSFDEGDSLVPQFQQVGERKAGRSLVIEFDGDDAICLAVPRYGHDGNGQVVLDGRIYGDNPFDSAGQQQTGIALQQFGTMAMADYEIEELLLQQGVPDAGEHGRRIAFADLRHHDAYREASLFAQATGERVRFVVQRSSSRQHSLLRVGGDAVLGGRGVHHSGDRGLG